MKGLAFCTIHLTKRERGREGWGGGGGREGEEAKEVCFIHSACPSIQGY